MNYNVYLILFYSISYFFFFMLLFLSKANHGLRLFDDKGFVSNPAMLIALHLGGILLFSVPSFLGHHNSFVLYDSNIMENPSTWVTLILFIILLFISPRLAEKKYSKSSVNLRTDAFPGIRFIIFYFIIRIVFIYVYEVGSGDIYLMILSMIQAWHWQFLLM
ncbi:MAG: hypothetical protein ABIP30_10340 [Ferruginibacter sp.]